VRVTEASVLFSDGAAYERLMGRWSQPVGRQFLDWIDPPKGLRWLDVGCGNGAFTEALIESCAPHSVVGIDPSEGQLAFARKRAGTKLAEFRAGDAQSLPFADDSFDAAAMALVIAFVPDAAKAVAEMARVVRAGGWVATYMWSFTEGGFPLAPLNEAVESMGFAVPARPGIAATPENFRRLWNEGGLREVETRTIHITVTYPDFDDFWTANTVPVGPTGLAVHGMPPAGKEELKALLQARLPRDAAGRISYGAHAHAVKGRVPT
jgi:ubiquinone/menaquinone biosynthesis C-methylase UbiE